MAHPGDAHPHRRGGAAQRRERETQKRERELKQEMMERRRAEQRAEGGDIIA